VRRAAKDAVNHLPGREKLLDRLEEDVLRGSTILLLGPLGIGKSSILAALASRLRDRARPCGLASDTRCLGDITAALATAYPEIDASSLTQRRLRSKLRLAVEARPGVLFLDHLFAAGTAMKGFLRSLRGTGLGVVLAADVENRRDHAATRALHLTHMEIGVPPLVRSTMAAILDARLSQQVLPHPLHEDDRKSLLQLAKGNPGKLVSFVSLLSEERFWRDGRVSTASVNGAALELILRRYLAVNTSP